MSGEGLALGFGVMVGALYMRWECRRGPVALWRLPFVVVGIWLGIALGAWLTP